MEYALEVLAAAQAAEREEQEQEMRRAHRDAGLYLMAVRAALGDEKTAKDTFRDLMRVAAGAPDTTIAGRTEEEIARVAAATGHTFDQMVEHLKRGGSLPRVR